MDDKPTTPVTPTDPNSPTTPVEPVAPVEPVTPSISDKPEDSSDKLEGKSNEELVKLYGEAQRKLGEMSGEVGKSRELLKQMNVILSAISKDPEREKIVKNWIVGLEEPDNKGREDGTEVNPEVADMRKTQEVQIIRRFEDKYGINKLESDKKQELQGKVANALWKVADPLGKYEKYEELVKAIPISKLEDLLERAYYEINKDLVIKKAAEFEEGTIGVLPSVSIPKDEVTLTPDEEKTADGLGVSHEKYLERKKEKLGAK